MIHLILIKTKERQQTVAFLRLQRMEKKKTDKKSYKSNTMIRKAVYSLEEVLPFISLDGKNSVKEYDGEIIPMDWETLQVLKEKGCACVACGAEASFVAMERTPGKRKTIYNDWHFNVYALDYIGRSVLMTKDHILAKANGGLDEMDNYQPMCIVCNARKGILPQRYFEAVLNDDFDDYNLKHTIKRAQERWGLEITQEDYSSMTRQVREGDDIILYRKNKSTTYREVTVQGVKKIILYSNKHGIITALEDNVKLSINKSAPWWAQQDVEAFLEEYDDVIAVCETEFQIKESPRQFAEYFKTCKYPKVMFSMWKEPGSDKFISIAWQQVKTNLKLN